MEHLLGFLGFASLLCLIFLRVPVGIAMLSVGVAGTTLLTSWTGAVNTMTGQVYAIVTTYSLSVLPLFIFMGNLATKANLSRDLYDAAYAAIGHLRGGLASATVIGCAGFAALSGSSIASASTMGRVSFPEMMRRQYDPALATGTIAAGGTLGILLPPSTGFVLYAILTEESIGRLFMAGILPGLLLTGLFVVTISILVWLAPEKGGKGRDAEASDPVGPTLLRAVPITGIILATIGGIYLGVFTPVEAAGAGAALTLVVALVRRKLSWSGFLDVISETLQTTGLVFMILLGAMVFAPFVALSGLPASAADGIIGMSNNPYIVMIAILVVYALLGMVIEGLSLMVITLPIVFPVVVGLGFDPIWFGVIMVLVLEMGLISPPVGVNCFVVKSVAPDVPLGTIFRGVFPFWAAMAVCIALLLAIPNIALLIPNAMFQ